MLEGNLVKPSMESSETWISADQSELLTVRDGFAMLSQGRLHQDLVNIDELGNGKFHEYLAFWLRKYFHGVSILPVVYSRNKWDLSKCNNRLQDIIS